MKPSGVLVLISVFSLLTSALPAFAEDKPLPEAAQHLRQAYEQAVARSTALLQLWGFGKKMAMDRVYLFKVKAG